MYHLRQGQRDIGHTKSNQIVIAEGMPDSKPLVLTWNNTSLYAWSFLDLKKDGPTVVELPPGVLGVFNDMYFRYMSDIGAAGPGQRVYKGTESQCGWFLRRDLCTQAAQGCRSM